MCVVQVRICRICFFGSFLRFTYYECYFCPICFWIVGQHVLDADSDSPHSKDLMICFVLFCFVSDASGLRERKHFSRDDSYVFAPGLENYINPPLRWLQVFLFSLSIIRISFTFAFRFPFTTFAFSLSSLFFETEIFKSTYYILVFVVVIRFSAI